MTKNDTQSREILVVEDDQDIQFLLKKLLESWGFNVSTALNGQEALTKLRSHETIPKLILLDLRMPLMDGFEFCDEISRDEELKEIPIVVTTAERDLPSVRSRLPSKNFIRKPFDLDSLSQTIEKFVKIS